MFDTLVLRLCFGWKYIVFCMKNFNTLMSFGDTLRYGYFSLSEWIKSQDFTVGTEIWEDVILDMALSIDVSGLHRLLDRHSYF